LCARAARRGAAHTACWHVVSFLPSRRDNTLKRALGARLKQLNDQLEGYVATTVVAAATAVAARLIIGIGSASFVPCQHPPASVRS
jgi:hypothetical protein